MEKDQATTHGFGALSTVALSPAALASSQETAQTHVADSLNTGGGIVTVSDRHPTAKAVAVEDGRIPAVGSKLAALVILDRNPLKVEPLRKRDIKLVEAIKEG
jgi:predicted amidohydrolase YtcJ